MSIFKRTKQQGIAAWRELPSGITRIDLITAERGPRTIETTLTLDEIEDLIRGRGQFAWPPYVTATDIEIMRNAEIGVREWQDLSRTERVGMRAAHHLSEKAK